jgi:acyl-CoA reductase-like NAD-dependent aldehyde dehydrogenase
MTTRLPVPKTYKLFIGGKFPRSESGRSMPVHDTGSALVAHCCRASRKDLRDAVEAARAAQAAWADATAYLRGQVLYRLAEMLEGKRAELTTAIGGADAAREVDAAIDRTVAMAGWPDKIGQVLGTANAVAGPYHNFTIPEPTGVVGVVCPDERPLLGLLTLTLPAIATGNAVVALASATNPIPAMVLAEAIATSDLPGSVVNILTGDRPELVPQFSAHREIAALHAANLPAEQAAALRAGAAENLKRVTLHGIDADAWFDPGRCEQPWMLEPFLEMKTVWHPSAT